MFASSETADELVGCFVFTLTDLNKCLYLPNHHRTIVLQCIQQQQFARFRATTTTGVVASWNTARLLGKKAAEDA
jgi:hypothetical protein